MRAIAVVIGALVGTSLRLALDALIPHPPTGFPISTLVINVVGAFALGLLVARVWPTAPPWLKAGVGTGLLGSFTTFSAMAVSLVQLAELGATPVAIAYLALTVVGGLAAAFAGIRLGTRGRGSPGPATGPIEADE